MSHIVSVQILCPKCGRFDYASDDETQCIGCEILEQPIEEVEADLIGRGVDLPAFLARLQIFIESALDSYRGAELRRWEDDGGAS